jgi:manganese oxidase
MRRRWTVLVAVAAVATNVAGIGAALHRSGGDGIAVTAEAPAATPPDPSNLATPLSAPLKPGEDIYSKGVYRGDGTYVAPYAETPEGVKEFHLRAAPINWETEPGNVEKGFAFNGIIPGPAIRVSEGDRIRIVVVNALPEPTVVHWHGMVLPFAQDGVHGVTQEDIDPGAAYTYEYTALATGTHWYHPHMTGDQVGKGLYGSLEVVPRNGETPVNRDYRLFIGDTNLGLVFNGKSFPATEAFPARAGEKVRIRMTATGEMSHPIHLHGQPFELVAQDGFPLATPQKMDTLLISTAQTFDIEINVLAPGQWLFHCHIFSHMHKEGAHDMAGLVTFLEVPDETGDLPLPDLTGTGLPLPQPGGLVPDPEETEPPEAPEEPVPHPEH